MKKLYRTRRCIPVNVTARVNGIADERRCSALEACRFPQQKPVPVSDPSFWELP